MKTRLCAVILLYAILLSVSPLPAASQQLQKDDPLPSWQRGPVRDRIIEFVTAVTDSHSSCYVPEGKRIAAFDLDGTLWVEKPAYSEILYMEHRIRTEAAKHPEWKGQRPFDEILRGSQQYLDSLEDNDIIRLFIATRAGMRLKDYQDSVWSWVSGSRHERFGKPYTHLTYRPMCELVRYLHSRGFTTVLCSGSEVDFVRAFSEKLFGIPPRDIIGSSLKYELQGSGRDTWMMALPGIDTFNNAGEKISQIHIRHGARPIMAVGNSNGDIEMLSYTHGGEGASLCLLIHHDDSAREYDYDDNIEHALARAKEQGWTVVSMKNDFARLFDERQD